MATEDHVVEMEFRGGPHGMESGIVPRPAPREVVAYHNAVHDYVPPEWLPLLRLYDGWYYLLYRLVPGPDIHYDYAGEATPPHLDWQPAPRKRRGLTLRKG